MERRHACLTVVWALAALCILAGAAPAEPWKFGVMADTQWTGADDGRNPSTCAVDIINQVNRRFIEERVKLVVAVGCPAPQKPVQRVSYTLDRVQHKGGRRNEEERIYPGTDHHHAEGG
jgi:hypothetical protein